MLINKGFLKVEILKISYFAQCNEDNTQESKDREKEKRSGAKQSNTILLFINP